MNVKIFILAVLTLLLTISFLPGNTVANSGNARQSGYEMTNKYLNEGLTYVRVYKDGIWYIYVYDGGILIDVYPE